MSETPKEDSTNLYDKIREEMREKQQAEKERKLRIDDMFNQKGSNPLDRLKGEKR